MTTRRAILAGSAATALTFMTRRDAGAGDAWSALTREFRNIESGVKGRLGVAVLDTATKRSAAYRAEERFPLCSTFKLIASAAVLQRCDRKQESLDRRVVFQTSDLVTYSPITEKHVGGEGMSMAEICAAALNYSDNTAGNLLLASLGGPPGFTAFARSIGDTVTRLDRIETELNEALPGDARDTTSPSAMLQTLQTLLLGTTLTDVSRRQLETWLLDNKTGGKRIRAGLPPDWRCGDKTGSGERGATNDVGILYPPQNQPVLIAVYLADCAAPAQQRDAVHAAVARAVTAARA